jgi:hypothetical protein
VVRRHDENSGASDWSSGAPNIRNKRRRVKTPRNVGLPRWAEKMNLQDELALLKAQVKRFVGHRHTLKSCAACV